jgi:hypothetical protein
MYDLRSTPNLSYAQSERNSVLKHRKSILYLSPSLLYFPILSRVLAHIQDYLQDLASKFSNSALIFGSNSLYADSQTSKRVPEICSHHASSATGGVSERIEPLDARFKMPSL